MRTSFRVSVFSAVSGVVIYLALPFVYLVSPALLKNFVYRELCYHTIIDEIKADSKDVRELVEKTDHFVHVNMDAHNIPELIDDNPWNAFVRGYGYCDQQAWALCTLLAKAGVPARLVMVRCETPLSAHSFAEVFVDGKWRLADPHLDTVHYNAGGELATFEDMHEGKVALKSGFGEKGLTGDVYRTYFTGDVAPVRWRPLTEKEGVLRRLVFSPVFLYYKIFGRKFSFFYQDLYLRGAPEALSRRNRYLTEEAYKNTKQ